MNPISLDTRNEADSSTFQVGKLAWGSLLVSILRREEVDWRERKSLANRSLGTRERTWTGMAAKVRWIGPAAYAARRALSIGPNDHETNSTDAGCSLHTSIGIGEKTKRGGGKFYRLSELSGR